MSAALGWGLGGFLPFDRLSMAGVAWAVEDSVGEDSILLTPKNRSIDPRQLKDSACVFPSTQTNSSSPASPCLSDTAQTLPSLQPATRGVRVQTNDRPWPVAWRQLPAGTEARVEISDTGLMQIAGVELLDTEDFTQQPVRWFDSEPMILTATIADGYRYLDITEFARQVGWEWIVQGETLYITSPTARVENIQTAVRDWGDQIAIELDTATPWQLDRTENGWVVLLDAAIPQRLVDRFRPRSDKNPQHKPLADESELPPFAIDTDGQQTRIHLKTSASVPPRIYSRSDAPELVIEMRPDSLMPRNLVWAPGIRWRQAMFDGEEAKFPVFWLEVDLRNPQVTLDPIWTQPDTQVGIAPLWQIAPLWGATAAINGGYFNRDRQLALGGIRRDGRWFSSPILDRGAIAWNDAGEARIARLTLEEMLLTSSGDRIPISTLNSGYVGAGVSRYTPEWGATYTPILNNEAIAIVYNRRIIEIQAGGKAGSRSVPIPPNGYILTIRDDPAALDRLTIGMELDTEQILDPPEFADYPDILAAGPVLMRDGQIVLDAEAERFNENFREGAAARSAIATTEAGTLLLVTIQNGTQGVGPTLEETAQIVRQLGAVDALNLDGGGSASLALGGQLVNRSPRNVSRVHNGLGVFLNFAP
ncbi:MAG: phosphodiester glycosidase family protein [Cyanobacteriota bacterium]|nr:phosphodiester glycosidase family protein [Cyanobacteriota bacterium]